MEKGQKRLATLVGCNYPNTRNELHGCINDVLTMRDVLVSRFGFEPRHIELLTDEPGAPIKPTGANIRSALDRMVDQAEPGDILFFHYSGHGTRIPSRHKLKQDEAIVPSDFNLITDTDFRKLVNRVPQGATFTIFSDSCHSGGLIDKEKEQIGPSVTNQTAQHRPRLIPFESILHHLTSLSGVDSQDIGTHLSELFGSDTSTKFLPQDIVSEVSEVTRPDAGILLSGCQANETSADMDPNGDTSKAYGAFSNSVQMVLNQHKEALSNREVIARARELLKAQGFVQHPCLYSSDENVDAPFLWQPIHSRV